MKNALPVFYVHIYVPLSIALNGNAQRDTAVPNDVSGKKIALDFSYVAYRPCINSHVSLLEREMPRRMNVPGFYLFRIEFHVAVSMRSVRARPLNETAVIKTAISGVFITMSR